jgi:uncharacterized cupin superfamily protein
VVPEAPLERKDGGLAPTGDGWFVLNVADARWLSDQFGSYTRFEDMEAAKFPHLGVNIGVLQPGQPACMYHGEEEQEDFIVLSGECLLLIEGEERALKQWDFVHCPPWTEHVFVGAGDGPCAVLAVGAREHPAHEIWGGYPVDALAQRHGAGVDRETDDADVAYAHLPPRSWVSYREGWLAG